jgi:hypothetical protein
MGNGTEGYYLSDEDIYLAQLQMEQEEQNVSKSNTGKVLLVRRSIKYSNTKKDVKQKRGLSRVRNELRPLRQV